MNDIERAIEVIEDGDWWDYTDVPMDTAMHTELHAALDLALAALRAKLNRESPDGGV